MSHARFKAAAKAESAADLKTPAPGQALLEMTQRDARELEKILAQDEKVDTVLATSELAQVDLPNLLADQKVLAVHQAYVSGDFKKLNRTQWESLHLEHFLAIRIHSLLVNLLAERNKKPKPNTASLTKEILTTLETLHLHRWLHFSHEATLTQQAKNKLILSQEISHRLARLENGDQVVLPARWEENEGHIYYVLFIKQDGAIYIRIDNFGDDNEMTFPKRHPLAESTLHNVKREKNIAVHFPRVIGKVLPKDHKRLQAYLEEVVVRFSKAAPNIAAFYDFKNHLPLSKDVPWKEIAYPEQHEENCVAYNWSIGSQERLTLPVFNAVVAAELAFLKTATAVKDQPQPALHRFFSAQTQLHPLSFMLQLVLKKIKYPHYSELSPQHLYAIAENITGRQDTKYQNESMTVPHVLNALAEITHLYLSRLKLTDQDIAQLRPILLHCTKLKILYLVDNQISDQGANILAETLPKMKSLTTLTLTRNQIKDAGVNALVSAATHSSLHQLVLAKNPYGNESALALAQLNKKFNFKKSPPAHEDAKAQTAAGGGAAVQEPLEVKLFAKGRKHTYHPPKAHEDGPAVKRPKPNAKNPNKL